MKEIKNVLLSTGLVFMMSPLLGGCLKKNYNPYQEIRTGDVKIASEVTEQDLREIAVFDYLAKNAKSFQGLNLPEVKKRINNDYKSLEMSLEAGVWTAARGDNFLSKQDSTEYKKEAFESFIDSYVSYYVEIYDLDSNEEAYLKKGILEGLVSKF